MINNIYDHFTMNKYLLNYMNNVTHSEIEIKFDNYNEITFQNMDNREWLTFIRDEYQTWKHTNGMVRAKLKRIVSEVDGQIICEIHSTLLSSDKVDIQNNLQLFCDLPGFGPPSASGVLSLMFPTHFGTVDRRVIGTFKQCQNSDIRDRLAKLIDRYERNSGNMWFSVPEAALVIQVYRDAAEELSRRSGVTWTPRMVDKALWSADCEANKERRKCGH